MRADLPEDQVEQLARLLEALAAEPDPPTTVSAPAGGRADPPGGQPRRRSTSRRWRGAARIADIGAGAGFPGLALAVALPSARVDLVESTRRKCEVIERLAEAAGVANATAVPERAEDWARGAGQESYDVVTARALAPLAGARGVRGAAAPGGGRACRLEGPPRPGRGARRCVRGAPARAGARPCAARRPLPRRPRPPPARPAEGRSYARAVSRAGRARRENDPLPDPPVEVQATREGLDCSGANHGLGGEFPTARASTLRDRWAPSSRSQTRRAASARRPPPSTSRPASPTRGTRPCSSTSTRSATPRSAWGWPRTSARRRTTA